MEPIKGRNFRGVDVKVIRAIIETESYSRREFCSYGGLRYFKFYVLMASGFNRESPKATENSGNISYKQDMPKG